MICVSGANFCRPGANSYILPEGVEHFEADLKHDDAVKKGSPTEQIAESALEDSASSAMAAANAYRDNQTQGNYEKAVQAIANFDKESDSLIKQTGDWKKHRGNLEKNKDAAEKDLAQVMGFTGKDAKKDVNAVVSCAKAIAKSGSTAVTQAGMSIGSPVGCSLPGGGILVKDKKTVCASGPVATVSAPSLCAPCIPNARGVQRLSPLPAAKCTPESGPSTKVPSYCLAPPGTVPPSC